MASENETVIDVCAEWRDCIESADPSVWNDRRIAGLVKTTKTQQLAYLARIEAAWKRQEKTYLDQIRDAVNMWGHEKYIAEHAQKPPVGNAAAMRETLVTIRKRLVAAYVSESEFMRLSPDKPLADLIDAALSAPARNCDLKECSSDDGMTSAHERFCESWHDDGKSCAECPHNPRSPIMTCREKWLLAPAAEEREGGSDEEAEG